jgi:hypothetical protein
MSEGHVKEQIGWRAQAEEDVPRKAQAARSTSVFFFKRFSFV